MHRTASICPAIAFASIAIASPAFAQGSPTTVAGSATPAVPGASSPPAITLGIGAASKAGDRTTSSTGDSSVYGTSAGSGPDLASNDPEPARDDAVTGSGPSRLRSSSR